MFSILYFKYRGWTRIKPSHEPVSSTRYKFVCVYSEDSNQSAHLHTQSDKCLRFSPEETLNLWLRKYRPLMTLMRLADPQADLSL